jgi:hypothetical protein
MIQEKDGIVATEWQPVAMSHDTPGFAQGFGRLSPIKVQWCKEYEGIGRFYCDTLFNQIYFERDEDRAMFLLRWAGK